MTTNSNNEYITKIEALILETRQRLDAQRTANQDQIDAVQGQIEALEVELKPLPGQAKTLRMAGFASRAREVVEEIESLNIRITSLQVEKAQLEADRRAGFPGAFRAIFPEINHLVSESIQAGEEQKLRIAQERVIALNLAGQPDIYERQYSQEAAEAQKRVHEAQDRLNKAIQGSQVPAA